MGQLHFYVSKGMEQALRTKAAERGVSVSRYVAEIVRKELGGGWPDGYFEQVVGAWSGEQLERAPQGEQQDRDAL